MFCHITQNWRGRPLVSHEVIVELIGHTTTQTGLRIQAELNPTAYPTGTIVSDAALAAVCLHRPISMATGTTPSPHRQARLIMLLLGSALPSFISHDWGN